MKCRYLQWPLIATALLLGIPIGSALAQDPAQRAAESIYPQPNAGQSTSPDYLQAIERRLQQQDAEIRELRQQIGGSQNAVHQLPDAPDSFKPSEPSNVLQAEAIVDPAVNPAVFQLQERMAALEQRMNETVTTAPRNEIYDNFPGYEVGSDLKMTANWNYGLQIQSANKDFRVHVGGRVQYDISAFDNDPALLAAPSAGGIGPQPNSTQFRRARVRIDGTMYEVFEWVAEYDFANTLAPASPSVGQPVATVPGLTELSITWTQLPYLGNFKAGNQREPMGMEHLTSDTFLPFLERSYLRDAIWGPFNNGYTPGMEVFDWWPDQRGTWAIGAFANQADSFGYGLGDEMAVTGRLTWLPIYDEPSDGAYLWHVGVSGSTRNPDNGQVRIRTRGDIRSGPPGVLNPIYGDTGTLDASWQNICGAETALNWGPWNLQAEWVGTWIEDAVSVSPVLTPRGTPFFQGGYVQVLYFLTGEHMMYNRHTAVFDRVIPYENAFYVKNCDGACSGWGAWQIGARYNAMDLNDNGINGGNLQSFTLGLNWYWNPNAKVQFNYDITNRSSVKTVPDGNINAWGLRFAYDF